MEGFIKGISTIAILTSLAMTDKKFLWDEACGKSFQIEKECLTTIPIFTLPQGVERFVMYTNPSNQDCGVVLRQNDNVVAYDIRQLKVHEKNYPSDDLEVRTVVFSLKVSRHHLYGAKFEVFPDHKSFKYIFTLQDLNLRHRSW